MTDFLASLAARNLGAPALDPAPEGDSVRPRPAATFEPEGSGLPAVEPDPHAEGPAGAADEPPGPPPDLAVPVTEPMAPAPAPPVIGDEARSETRVSDRTVQEIALVPPRDPPPTPEIVVEMRGDAVPEAPEPRMPLPPEKPPDRQRDVETPLRPVPESPPVNEAVRAPVPDPRSPPPPDPNAAQEVTDPGGEDRPAPQAGHRPRVDEPLERIVRQMVLAPARQPIPSDAVSGKARGSAEIAPPLRKAPSESNAAPQADMRPRRADPEQVIAEPAHLRPVRTPDAPMPSLAPVPDPTPPPEPAAPETTIRISIGRIEVTTGNGREAETTERPARPEPVLMSLDDYLAKRSGGG